MSDGLDAGTNRQAQCQLPQVPGKLDAAAEPQPAFPPLPVLQPVARDVALQTVRLLGTPSAGTGEGMRTAAPKPPIDMKAALAKALQMSADAIAAGTHSEKPPPRVCQGCRQWTDSIWHRTEGGDDLCRACAIAAGYG